MQKFADLRVPGIVLAPLILLAACTEARAPAAASPSAEDSAVQGGLLPAAPVAQPCGKHGSLETTVFGALAGDIRWYGSEMSCEGMPRPEGAGARLRFAGTAGADALDLAIIIALPELEPTATARELPSKLTLIEEGRGRFFSSGEQPNCWTDVARQEPLADGDGEFVIAGTLFCIGPLAEVNGDASVTIEELQFSGSLDWNTQ